jgi:PBSX family phage terminase large subunit
MLAPLVGKQLASAHLATARLNIWEGSVRSSKTVSSSQRWIRYVRQAPPGDLLLAGRTERTAFRNIISPLINQLGEARCRYIAGKGELHMLGRRIYVVGANDESSQERIRGLTLAGAYVDEASTVPESFWTMLISRLSVEGAQLFATTNPDAPAHWLKKRWLDRAWLHLPGSGPARVRPCAVCDRRACPPGECEGDDRLDLHRFSFRLTDNPYLPRKYVRDISREYVGLWYRRFILGEWVVAEGAVYDMFDPARHVVAGLPPGETIVAQLGTGVDYGTRNPFAAVRLALTSEGRLYVPGEWGHDPESARRQLTDAEFSAELRAWLGDTRGWLCIDPSAASFKVQLHRDGVPSVTDADNSVLDGIRLVAALLGTDRLVVHESAAGLIDELPGYSWDDKAAERGEDKPLKVADHYCDALRYAVATTQALWRPHVQLAMAA